MRHGVKVRHNVKARGNVIIGRRVEMCFAIITGHRSDTGRNMYTSVCVLTRSN